MTVSPQPIVAVGMSGGVDSSVAAYLLKEAGYKVIGLFMRNWDEEDKHCTAAKDFEDVVSVCRMLDIPYYTINFTEEYYNNVFVHFIEGLKQGITPNPDVFCNKEIKFKVFLEKALQIGANFLATGHYAKIEATPNGLYLKRAKDLNKDQSYFLYTLQQKELEKAIFPLQDLNKAEVRAIAKRLGLVTSDKKDSTGICFIGKRKFKEFIEKYIAKTQGHFIDERGKIIGKHEGLSYYTIGQRKGLGIGGEGEAWYVAHKEMKNNTITLVQGSNHPMLYKQDIFVYDLTFITPIKNLSSLSCTAKVRYRSIDIPCTLTLKSSSTAVVTFLSPVFAPTPGQSIVFYQEETCLGGGIISFLTGTDEVMQEVY